MDFFLFALVLIDLCAAVSVNKLFGRFGSVKIDFDGSSKRWTGSWPEGIRLVNSYSPKQSFPITKSYQNSTDYPYSADDTVNNVNDQALRKKRKTFSWTVADELLISTQLECLSKPTSTRIVPPISWFASTASKVKVHQNSAIDDYYGVVTAKPESSRYVEIVVRKYLVEQSLSFLRVNGFGKKDVYRLLDKGPWTLAFNIPRVLPRLFEDLKHSLGLDQSQIVHILSHCPYLIAAYARYRGKDIESTVKALRLIGYTEESLIADIMRFPSILSCPPDRIIGWKNLMEGYGVVYSSKEPFYKFLKKANFMYNINPPQLFSDDNGMQESEIPNDRVDATASGYISYDSMKILDLLVNVRVSDINKVLRTCPNLLLVPYEEVQLRMNFLINLFLDSDGNQAHQHTASDNILANINNKIVEQVQDVVDSVIHDSAESSQEESHNCELFGGDIRFDQQKGGFRSVNGDILKHCESLILSYPAVLSIDHKQMRNAIDALLEMGFKRSYVKSVVRIYPKLLSLPPQQLKGIVFFLKQQCGFKQGEIMTILLKFPAILNTDIIELQVKVDYLVKSMNGSIQLLKRYPNYLLTDFASVILPRSELIKALEKESDFRTLNGFQLVLTSSDDTFAYNVGIQLVQYSQFKTILQDKWNSNRVFNGKGGSSVGSYQYSSSTSGDGVVGLTGSEKKLVASKVSTISAIVQEVEPVLESLLNTTGSSSNTSTRPAKF